MFKKIISIMAAVSMITVCGNANVAMAEVASDKLDISSINWAEVEDIDAFAKNNDLEISIDYLDSPVEYNEQIANNYKYQDFVEQRNEIDHLLEELESDECITYYPASDTLVVEKNNLFYGDVNNENVDDFSCYLQNIVDSQSSSAVDIYGRSRIISINSAPYCYTASLKVLCANGGISYGTGFFVDSDTILTSAHLVYSYKYGGYAEDIIVYPGGNASDFIPQSSTEYRVSPSWLNSDNYIYDYALISVDEPMVSGNFTLQYFSDSQLLNSSNYFLGFPSDRSQGEEMWQSRGTITNVYPDYLYSSAYSTEGNSGGPAPLYTNILKPVGIVTGQATIDGEAIERYVCVRLNSSVINFVNANK